MNKLLSLLLSMFFLSACCTTPDSDEIKPVSIKLEPWEQEVRVNNAIRFWMTCRDCRGSDSGALEDLGDSATTRLGIRLKTVQSLLLKNEYGNVKEFELRMYDRRLRMQYREIRDQLSSRDVELTEDAYVSLFIRNWLSLQSEKTRLALVAINTPEAQKILDEAGMGLNQPAKKPQLTTVP